MFLIDISSTTIYRHFEMFFPVFLIFSFCSRSVLLSTLWGPSRVFDYFHPVEWCLRLDGDLERLWWKLFILMNLDLSEIHKNNSGFWDKSAFRGQQSVAKMMTSFAFSCLCYHRGVSDTREHPGSRQSKLTRNTGS